MTIYQIFWYFIIYSLIGWMIEVVFHAVTQGKIVNRGFLNGPICPVYGSGVLMVLIVLFLVGSILGTKTTVDTSHPMILFAIGIVFASLIEFLAGFILDKLFHARWWDYSNEPFNFRGYICPRFSMIWGLACLLVVRVVQPAMANSLLLRIPERIGWPILGVLYVTFLADFVVTVMIVAGLNKKLRELDEVQRRMRIVSDGLSEKLGEGTMRAQTTIEEQRLQATLAKYEARDAMQNQKKKMQEKASQAKAQRRDSQERASALKEKILSGRFFGSRRILEAFPNMKHREYDAALMDVQRDLQINEKERKE
jgi:uncharacterized membrane protein